MSPTDRRRLARLRATSPVPVPDPVWTVLATAYTEPHRAYHTLEHLDELRRAWSAVARGPGWTDPRSTWLALLFHDVVYAVGQPDNEARSAALLRTLLPDTAAAERLVLLTARHGAVTPDDADAAHFLDADMAILGASPVRFARYQTQVAREYAPVVGADAYRAGRGAFLAFILATPRIFVSPWFHGRLEARARRNLAAAVAAAS